MRETTVLRLDRWWADTFDVTTDRVWDGVSVRPHTRLGDYEGWWVAWRSADGEAPTGVHVSAPASATAAQVARLEQHDLDTLADPDFWRGFAGGLDQRVVGPATHTYLDVDPGPAQGVVALGTDELARLRTGLDAADWEESGWADSPPLAWGVLEGDEVLAAANLNPWDGAPRDIGVAVLPEHRGLGLARVVGRHAASYAVREHDVARWSARDDNLASLATARVLGFEPWCTQLAVRRAG